MDYIVTPRDQLNCQSRWDPRSTICDVRTNRATVDGVDCALGELVVERKSSAQPPLSANERFVYVGLENVESRTGDVIGSVTKSGGEVRSRSKLFKRGDILFGRLRPNLAKVFFCATASQEGYCSGEFIVLSPRADDVSGRVLRQMLASGPVIDELIQRVAGAALPRVSAEALLAVRIPRLSAARMAELDVLLLDAENQRVQAKALLAAQPDLLDRSVWPNASYG